MRGSEGTQSSAWESQERRILSNSFLCLLLFLDSPPPTHHNDPLLLFCFTYFHFLFLLLFFFPFRVAHIICFLFYCSWQKESLVIEQYRTCALPERRWQMDYKNFKGKHLEHQGRDARYLNYHSLPRRQWLPDMVHTSRNSATAQT